MSTLSARDRLADLVSRWSVISLPKGATVATFTELVRKFIKSAMLIVDGIVPSNAEKKALVLEYAGKLFDYFAPKLLIVLPWYLFWLKPFLAAQARDQFLSAMTVLIEVIFVEEFKTKNIPLI